LQTLPPPTITMFEFCKISLIVFLFFKPEFRAFAPMELLKFWSIGVIGLKE